MKFTYYSICKPSDFIKMEKTNGHSIFLLKEGIHISPDEFSPQSINPSNILKLKEKLNIESIFILDRIKPQIGEVCIVDHVNRSGINFLKGNTPQKGLPTFPDMSCVYNQIAKLKKVVVHTVGPTLFESKNPNSLVISESVGIVAPIWHYVQVKVFAKGVYGDQRRSRTNQNGL